VDVELWPGRLESKFGWDSCIFCHCISNGFAPDNVETRPVHTVSHIESPRLVMAVSIPSPPISSLGDLTGIGHFVFRRWQMPHRGAAGANKIPMVGP